jgi:hypothetical protein
MIKTILTLALMTSFLAAPAQARSKVIAKKRGAKVIRQTNDKTSCFPKKLTNMLLQISKHFNKPVEVVSGYRSPKDNKRRGGAPKSMHIHCKAADFRVPGASTKSVGKYLARMKNRGGAGFYCRGRFHIDVGSRRSWGGCKASYVSFTSGDSIESTRNLEDYSGEIIYQNYEEVEPEHYDTIDFHEDHILEKTIEI